MSTEAFTEYQRNILNSVAERVASDSFSSEFRILSSKDGGQFLFHGVAGKPDESIKVDLLSLDLRDLENKGYVRLEARKPSEWSCWLEIKALDELHTAEHPWVAALTDRNLHEIHELLQAILEERQISPDKVLVPISDVWAKASRILERKGVLKDVWIPEDSTGINPPEYIELQVDSAFDTVLELIQTEVTRRSSQEAAASAHRVEIHYSDDGEPIFEPPAAPDSLTESKSYQLLNSEIATRERMQEVVSILFHEPENPIHLYVREGEDLNPLILQAQDQHKEISLAKTEFHYFAVDGTQKNFVQIRGGLPRNNAECKIVDKSAAFRRYTVVLTERKRRELETWERIQLEEQLREKHQQIQNEYDVFLSYSSVNEEQAQLVYKAATTFGAKVFLAKKTLEPGQDFADAIRVALRSSSEIWLIVSPDSLNSEWVTTEWGAAWVLQKKIVPVLFRCAPPSLPDRLARLHCIDFHEHQQLVEKRFGKAEKP